MTTEKSSKSSRSPMPKSAFSSEKRPTRVQKFAMERVNRADIHGAPYNPRTIDRHAKAKLEKNLRSVGLLQPIVVNRRTMNVVSGHQRLATIDAIEGCGDYVLDVSMVELSDKEEKAQNVFMNNVDAMGTWDTVALESLLKDIGKEAIPDTGFDAMSLASIDVFDDLALEPMFAEEAQPAPVKDALAEIDKIAAIKQAKKAGGKEQKNDSDCYAVVVFANREEQMRFVKRCGCEESARYVDGAAVWRLIGE